MRIFLFKDNRTEATLDDIYITLSNLDININELLDYTYNVEPVPLTVEIPKFPAHKNTNLNFLKPGSKEVLIRPVHIFEYLPPILPADSKSSLPSQYLHSDSQFFKLSSINVTNDVSSKIHENIELVMKVLFASVRQDRNDTYLNVPIH